MLDAPFVHWRKEKEETAHKVLVGEISILKLVADELAIPADDGVRFRRCCQVFQSLERHKVAALISATNPCVNRFAPNLGKRRSRKRKLQAMREFTGEGLICTMTPGRKEDGTAALRLRL